MVEIPRGVGYVSTEVALEDMSTGVLLSVQAAYLAIPYEERAHAACRRLDAISAEVSERARPLPSNLPTLYATAARGDWRVGA